MQKEGELPGAVQAESGFYQAHEAVEQEIKSQGGIDGKSVSDNL